eukprot:jgi/Tetstr1/458069/TSEL_044576.t1
MNRIVVALPQAGTVASPKLKSVVGVLRQHLKKAGGIIKHNTNAVKNMAATQVFTGDNVDEVSSPEPPAKKPKQPAKPAVEVPARGWGGYRTRAWAVMPELGGQVGDKASKSLDGLATKAA